jgi:DNA-binding CsgD family transcriptional regulator
VAAGPGTVTWLNPRAGEVAAGDDHATAWSGTALFRPRRLARLRDVSRSVRPGAAGERPPVDDDAGAGEGAGGIEQMAVTLGEQLLLAASLGQWDRVEALATQVRAVVRLCSAPCPSCGAAGVSLTGAELRLLPLLATHLSLPQIGAELFLSPHTVKSQAVSIYRKLGVSSRCQAVASARESGLLER